MPYFRSRKAAAPSKQHPLGFERREHGQYFRSRKAAAPLKLSCVNADTVARINFRSRKAAAPLKLKLPRQLGLEVVGFPQSKGCGSIEAQSELFLSLLIRAPFPQSKGCGSVKAAPFGIMGEESTWGMDVSAVERLRLRVN